MAVKIFKFIFIIICVIVSFALVGCQKQSIDFRRDSKVTELMKNLNTNKNGEIKKSSGIFIYKDTSSSDSEGGMMFGPNDIIFDLPIKF